MSANGDGCDHGPEHEERLEVIEFDDPVRCLVCTNEAALGFRFRSELGHAELCERCLTVIRALAQKRDGAGTEATDSTG